MNPPINVHPCKSVVYVCSACISDNQRLNPLSVFRGSNLPALSLCASVAKIRVSNRNQTIFKKHVLSLYEPSHQCPYLQIRGLRLLSGQMPLSVGSNLLALWSLCLGGKNQPPKNTYCHWPIFYYYHRPFRHVGGGGNGSFRVGLMRSLRQKAPRRTIITSNTNPVFRGMPRKYSGF